MVFAKDDDPEEGQTSGRKLTRRQVIDNAMLLLLAGSETSASTLANCMLFLGLQKDTWNKLVQEQRAMQEKYGDELTKEALDKDCPYLEGVIKESMRLKPVSGGIPRVTKETVIVDGLQIPKGWVVNWSIGLTHELDPKSYQVDRSHMDVLKGFRPERWLDESTAPDDFIPLGAGPRYCLGANLAYAEMKVFLAVLARKLDFELAGQTDKLKWKRMSIIPKVVDGVPVKVEARTPAMA
jgi:retinoid hydroxylase